MRLFNHVEFLDFNNKTSEFYLQHQLVEHFNPLFEKGQIYYNIFFAIILGSWVGLHSNFVLFVWLLVSLNQG